jgi:hypothetical protein
MADRKISDLTALTAPAAGDYLPIVDISEASAANKNKRITMEELLRGAPDGTAAAPSIGFESDPNTGIYRPGADQVAISTGGTGRLFVDSSGRVGIGTASPDTSLTISYSDSAFNPGIKVTNTSNTSASQAKVYAVNNSGEYIALVRNSDALGGGSALFSTGAAPLAFSTDSTERVRIDSSGRLLVGTSTARSNFFNTSWTPRLQIEGTSDTTSAQALICNSNDIYSSSIQFAKSRGATIGSNTVVQANDYLGSIGFQGSDGTEFVSGASIEAFVDGTPGANDMPTRLVFSTTADGASSPTERMRITNGGSVNIGSQGTDIIWNQTSVAGVNLGTSGVVQVARSNDTPVLINRIGNDGKLIVFAQDGTEEGDISVSGSTVTLNGAHLSRWSQLPGGAERIEILRGTVLSNIDEMCQWGDEDNEQLNRMKVSDVEGDLNVAGVFQSWDDDDDTYTDDFYCAMTGDFIIRISAGIPVHRGQLLMSTGDGTAIPQDDDIVRSKTIAKVTSNHVTCTYEDGSYCVPCVLMAC